MKTAVPRAVCHCAFVPVKPTDAVPEFVTPVPVIVSVPAVVARLPVKLVVESTSVTERAAAPVKAKFVSSFVVTVGVPAKVAPL